LKSGFTANFQVVQNAFETVGMAFNLISFLENQNPKLYTPSLKELETKIASLEVWYQRYYALQILKEYSGENDAFKSAINQVYQRLLAVEKDQKVLMYLGVK